MTWASYSPTLGSERDTKVKYYKRQGVKFPLVRLSFSDCTVSCLLSPVGQSSGQVGIEINSTSS